MHKEGIVITDFTKPKEIKGHTAYGVSGIVRVQTHVWYEGANGIQLTQEILEKCGFERDVTCMRQLSLSQTELWLLRFYEQPWMESSFAFYDGDEYSYIPLLKSPQYLHQLQNLFYSLCGVELNVQL